LTTTRCLSSSATRRSNPAIFNSASVSRILRLYLRFFTGVPCRRVQSGLYPGGLLFRCHRGDPLRLALGGDFGLLQRGEGVGENVMGIGYVPDFLNLFLLPFPLRVFSSEFNAPPVGDNLPPNGQFLVFT
jgi:hypothetical protein